MIEIERKFLVISKAYETEAVSQERVVQGFLNTHPERTVRVRIKGEKGFLTIKGKSNASGTKRLEWEREIDVAEAEALLPLCEPGVIEKTRYEVPFAGHVFEVDAFSGGNLGLVVAEVELQDENETVELPPWIGKEVTGEIAYYNSQLSKKPYSSWKLKNTP